MTVKPGSGKKSGGIGSGDTGDKERRIKELESRIAVLENELLSKDGEASSRDVILRKRARALRETEEEFRTIFERAGVAIFMADPGTGEIIDCNAKSEELIGRPREEIVGFHQTLLHPGEMAAERSDAFALNAGRDSITNFETVVQHRDGRVIPVMINAARVTVNGRTVILGLFLDITERKRAEEALQLTQFAIDNFLDSAIWVTPDGRIAYVNLAACDTLGYSREDLLSMHICDIDPNYTPEEFRELWPEKLQGRYTTFESKHVTRDGRVLPVEITSCYTKYGDKELLITFDRDISERKQTEEGMKAAKRQAELYLDLMGHDLSNMHQVALGYLELARDMPPGEDQVKFLDKPIEVLQRSAKLISNVRKLQKLNDGMFQNQDIDVCKVLSDVQREYGAVPNKTITISLNGFEHCYVSANELLHDVFSNLVGNAVKHTGDRAAIVMDLDVVEDKGSRYCRVIIEDDGPGIPDNFKGVIFNRTLKGTNKAKGIGLGLYLVKSLVESYGGQVWVEDRIIDAHTKGARFVVTLPAVDN